MAIYVAYDCIIPDGHEDLYHKVPYTQKVYQSALCGCYKEKYIIDLSYIFKFEAILPGYLDQFENELVY